MKFYCTAILIFFGIGLCSSQEDVSRTKKKYAELTKNVNAGNYKLARLQADTMYMLAAEDKDTLGLASAVSTIAGFESYKGNTEVVDSMMKIAADYFMIMDEKVEASLIYSEVSGTQRMMGNIDSAYHYAHKARSLLKEGDRQQAYIFNSNVMSLVYNRMGKGDSAIYYELDVIERLEPTDSFRLCTAYANLASSFGNIRERVKQKEYLDKAYSYAIAKGLKTTRATIAYKIAMYEKSYGDVAKAKKYAEECLMYWRGSTNKAYLNYGYSIMAATLLKEGRDEEAAIYIDSIPNLDKLKNLEIKSALLLGKMNVYLKTDPNRIDQQLLASIDKSVMEINQLQPKSHYYWNMSEYYRLLKDYKKVDEYNQKYLLVKDSLNSADNRAIVNDLQEKYETEKKELAIENLELVTSRQRQRLIGGGIALGLISLLSFFLYRLYQKVNSQKRVIEKALTEKDILLREIHHRVKNNLQLVSSLLTMQGRSIDDETAQQAINEGKTRVRSMALIHQDLYNRENLTEISVKNYVEKLTKELFSTYRVDAQKVSLDLQVEDMDLDVDTLVPLGLIINELITNSLKYAWPNGREGSIKVSLKDESGNLVLSIADDGIGYDPTNVRTGSFGSTLISALTSQLEGNLSIETNGGTKVVLKIPDYLGS